MMKVQRTLTVINKLGLHARASAQLVKLASLYCSDIRLKLDQQTANGKNIMELMMLAASQDSEIVVIAEGSDAAKAVDAIEALFLDRFKEAE